MKSIASVLIALLLLGCDSGSNGNTDDSDGLPDCPDGKKVFAIAPVPLANVRGWEPLGHMGPPGHTFPTDHQYLYLKNPDSPGSAHVSVPLFAPANVRIVQLYKSSYSGGLTDYSVFFQPCGDVKGRFGHVGSISQALTAAAGPIDQSCSTYEPNPGYAVTGCSSRPFTYDATVGEQIGTAGDGGSIALDWWLQDRRVTPVHFTNPARFSQFSDRFDARHIVPASEYFVDSMAARVTAKLGRYDGQLPRTAAPMGGTVAVDVDSTARGYWFNPNQPYPPESYQAALAPDYVTPDTTQVFSIGLSQPDTMAFYGTFKPRSSGTVNRAFESVKADGHIYCYDLIPNIILLQLADPITLRLEIRHNTVPCVMLGAYRFGVGKTFDYKR